MAIYLVAIGSHIFLDVITSFGTMVWSPLNYSRPAWDLVFIVDLTFTSLALMPQLASWAFRPLKDPWRRSIPLWAVFSAAAFAIGPLVRPLDVPFSTGASLFVAGALACFFLLPLRHCKRFARGTREVVPHRSGSRGRISGLRGRHASFGFSARFRICQRGASEQYSEYSGDASAAFTGAMGRLDRDFRRNLSSPVRSVGRRTVPASVFSAGRLESIRRGRDADLSDVQTFLWFARFPLFKFFERDGKPVVDISDMRFYGPPRRAALPGDTDPPTNFTFEVVFAPDGRILSQGRLREE